MTDPLSDVLEKLNVVICAGIFLVMIACSKTPTVHTREEAFMNCLHIIQCTNGLYQLKTDITIFGEFTSLTEARISKTNLVKRLMKLNELRQVIPDCGNRIE